MEATPSATQAAKSISVLDAVIWIAEATNGKRYFQKAGFSTNKLIDNETE
jgi:hypothetical protein